jgi:Flp pilus assembly CpaF family ATPase
VTVRWHPAGAHRRLRALVAERVRERIDAVTLARATPAERRVRVGEEALAVLREHRVVLSARDLTRLVNEISDEVVGLGPIESLLKDPEVSEVMVNGATTSTWSGRGGSRGSRLQASSRKEGRISAFG